MSDRLALQALCCLPEGSGARGQAFGISPKRRPVLLHIVRIHQFGFSVVKDGQQLDLHFEEIPIRAASQDELRAGLCDLDYEPIEGLNLSPPWR